MTSVSGMRTARLAGTLVGVAAAAALLLASRPASGGTAVGADVGVDANQTGELAVSPPGPAKAIDAPALRPGDSATGRFRIANQTGVRERIRLIPSPSEHSLDRALSLRLASRARTLGDGPLGSFAARRPLVLDPGQAAYVNAKVSLAPEAGSGVAAALVDVAIGFRLEPVR
jgi:hypothetical protein